MLKDWALTPRYWAFRVVVVAKAIFQVGTGSFTSFALYFLQDCTEAGDAGAQRAMSILGLVNLFAALAAAYPAGKLADRFGSVLLVNIATFISGCVLLIAPTVDKVTTRRGLNE